MYTLLKLLPIKRLLAEQMPTVLLAGVIAELFYKFHSFTLECVAFLATWFVLDAIVQMVKQQGPRVDGGPTKPEQKEAT